MRKHLRTELLIDNIIYIIKYSFRTTLAIEIQCVRTTHHSRFPFCNVFSCRVIKLARIISIKV